MLTPWRLAFITALNVDKVERNILVTSVIIKHLNCQRKQQYLQWEELTFSVSPF